MEDRSNGAYYAMALMVVAMPVLMVMLISMVPMFIVFMLDAVSMFILVFMAVNSTHTKNSSHLQANLVLYIF
jgi:hypothetical protein